MGQRLSSHGHGTWQFPGGHLEYGEDVFACAERETLEETGLVVKATKLAAVTNSVFGEVGKHYITLFVLCEPTEPDATPQVRRLNEPFPLPPHYPLAEVSVYPSLNHMPCPGVRARQSQRLAVDAMVHHL